MSAIRFRYNAAAMVVEEVPGNSACVPVRTKDGDFERLGWLGFICMRGAERLVSLPAIARWAEIVATGVCDDRYLPNRWINLGEGQYALGVVMDSGGGGYRRFSVYGVIDENCWPVVVGGEPIKTWDPVKAPVYKIA